MKSIFQNDAYNEIISRLNKLNPNSDRQWGKMDVSQMMAHCCGPIRVGLSDKPMPRAFIGLLLGWMMKSKLYNDSPWGKDLPTAKEFYVRDARDFETEKKNLSALLEQFHKKGEASVGKYPHPFFGKFSGEQWGKSIYKHMDHHLRQFNA